MNKKRIIIVTIIIILVVILGLWINGIIPKQIARISATNVLLHGNSEDGNYFKSQIDFFQIIIE